MGQGIKLQFQADAVKNLPFQIFDKDFKFIVNGQEFQTSRFITYLLSPKIVQMCMIDPTIDTFYITTKSHTCDFNRILELATFSSVELKEEEIPFFSEIFEILEISSTIITKLSQSTVTEDNVIELLFRHSISQHFYKTEIDEEILFASSYFSNLLEVQHESIKDLPYLIIENIMNCKDLSITDEDQLLEFANDMYLKNGKECISLYEYIIFKNCSKKSIGHFIDIFNINHITQELWPSLSKRILSSVSDSRWETESSRYTKKPWEELDRNVGDFHGIIRRMKEEGIQVVVSCLSYSTHKPSNVIDYDNIDSIYHSTNSPNQWICFDFGDHSVVLNCYQVRSCYGGPNSANPRSWVIEGSNDNSSRNEDWIGLDDRPDCDEINDQHKVGTFNITKPQKLPFRYIRMRLTGNNWGGNDYFLISAIEFYGKFN